MKKLFAVVFLLTLSCISATPPSTENNQGAAVSGSSDVQRILDLLHGLVGEWQVHNVREDGSVFRVRSVYELGPDGQSLIARGWLGDEAAFHPHGASQVWRAPAINGTPGGIMFQSIDENGAIARGPITPWMITPCSGSGT
jgi:hypothetical protein